MYQQNNYSQNRIDKAIADKNTRIDKLVDRREKSIAFFNSVNAAVALLGKTATETKIAKWRDWFYTEWQNWYLDTMVAPEVKKIKDWVKEVDAKKPSDHGKQPEQERINESSQIESINAELQTEKLPIIELK